MEAVPAYIPISSVRGFPFSTSSGTLVVSCVIDSCCSDSCGVVSYCGFDCISLLANEVENLFIYLLAIVSFLGKSVQALWPFFNWFVCFFVVELYEVFIYFGY